MARTGDSTQAIVDQLVGAAHGDLPTVQALLAQYPDLLNAIARWNETPIQATAHAGARPVAEFLLARGAHVTALDYGQKTPLQVADLLRARGGRE